MNRSGAMEAQQFGPSCRDGRQDNREVVSPLVDQTARRFAETRRRPGAIAVLLEQARMARRFLRAGRLSLDLGQLYRRMRARASASGKVFGRASAKPLRPKTRISGAKVAP